MPDTEGSRLARVEAVLEEVRSDIQDARAEQQRTRDRLHAMEAAVQGLVLVQRDRIDQQERIFKTLGLRLQRLGVSVAVGALLVSVVALLVHFQ